MFVSSSSQGCVVIPANLMECCGVGHFHCDFLEGQAGGLTKKYLAVPKKSCRDISESSIPPWAFLQLGCLLRILNRLLANRHLAS